MPDLNWNALFAAPNAGDSVMQGFEHGRKLRQEDDLRRAIGRYQAGDTKALGVIMQLSPQTGMALQDQAYQQQERARAGEARAGMAQLLLGGQGVNALAAHAPAAVQPATPGGGTPYGAAHPMGGIQGQQPLPSPSPTPNPQGEEAGISDGERRLINADPEAFLKFQGQRLTVNKAQFEQLSRIHDGAMQLLGGVHDQASYDAAKQQALQLYGQFGHDASDFISQLPAEYSPETIHDLQLQGMDTSKQLAAVARENNIESLIDDRSARFGEYQRHNQASEANTRRGQDMRGKGGGGGRAPAPKAPSPTSVVGRIMDKQAKGQRLTPAEQKTYDEYRAGRGGGGGRRGGSGADRIGPVYQRDGHRIQYSKSAGGYVDLSTGKPVQ